MSTTTKKTGKKKSTPSACDPVKKAKTAVKWWYKSDDNKSWKQMTKEDAELLEDAWSKTKGSKTTDLELAGFTFNGHAKKEWTYQIDFVKMTQTNPVRKTTRAISRGAEPGKDSGEGSDSFPSEGGRVSCPLGAA